MLQRQGIGEEIKGIEWVNRAENYKDPQEAEFGILLLLFSYDSLMKRVDEIRCLFLENK